VTHTGYEQISHLFELMNVHNGNADICYYFDWAIFTNSINSEFPPIFINSNFLTFKTKHDFCSFVPRSANNFSIKIFSKYHIDS
jgi:hypothetical protein